MKEDARFTCGISVRSRASRRRPLGGAHHCLSSRAKLARSSAHCPLSRRSSQANCAPSYVRRATSCRTEQRSPCAAPGSGLT
jgi:hypothetical protein